MNYLQRSKSWAWRIPIAIAIIFGFQFGLFDKVFQTDKYVLKDTSSHIISAKNFNQSIQQWQFVPGSITDGESLQVARGTEKYQIVLCGINSPPSTQPLGIEARDYLKSFFSR